VKVRGDVILRAFIAISSLAAALVAAQSSCAQSIAQDGPIATGIAASNTGTSANVTGSGNTSTPGLKLVSLAALPDALAPAISAPVAGPATYVPPTQEQRFHDFAWNAVGPVAFAGAAFAGAIDQGFNFQHAWGQGWNAYGVRVASNLGISMVTATSQYGIAEALHEDTAYYRCTCTGFARRFFHAGLSSVTSRRGDDGHLAFSPALTISPFIGPMVAANTWIPTHNGAHLGFTMGEHNLLGQFAQDEALEFVYGGPHTLLGHIQRHLKRFSSNASQ
jgi:hypothetical protein